MTAPRLLLAALAAVVFGCGSDDASSGQGAKAPTVAKVRADRLYPGRADSYTRVSGGLIRIVVSHNGSQILAALRTSTTNSSLKIEPQVSPGPQEPHLDSLRHSCVSIRLHDAANRVIDRAGKTIREAPNDVIAKRAACPTVREDGSVPPTALVRSAILP